MKKNKMWVAVAVIVVLVALYAMMSGQKAVTVDVDEAIKSGVEKYIEDTAEVKLTHQTPIFAVSAGRLTTLKVKEGDVVKRGDVLAMLDQQSVSLQIEDLQAQYQAVEAQYREARKPVSSNEMQKLLAADQAALASLDEAKQTLSRNQTLFEAGALSEVDYKSSKTEVAAKEALWQAARSSVTQAKEGLSKNTRKQYEAQLSEVAARKALLEKQMNDMAIVAPMDGMILTKSIESGSYVQPGMKLFEIGEPSQMYLTCDVLVEDIRDIKIGTPVRLLNNDLSIQNLMAKVSKIYPTAFTKVSDLGINQKRITVEMALNAEAIKSLATAIRPGYELTAQFVVQSNPNAITIDKKALFDSHGKPTVFVIESGKVQLRSLEKGIEGEDRVEIVKGLKIGDQVVISPDDKIKPGISIKKKVQ